MFLPRKLHVSGLNFLKGLRIAKMINHWSREGYDPHRTSMTPTGQMCFLQIAPKRCLA